jgi:chorismate synthase
MSFRKLRLLTSGESHGPAVSAILEGIPSGLAISREKLQHQMKRRQLGFGRGARMKIESDEVQITGGVRFGRTIGSPIALVVANRDFQNWQSAMNVWEEAVESRRDVTRPRPGHADLAGGLKYDEHDLRNILERASARETVGRVAAGAICLQLLSVFGIEIVSHVLRLGRIESSKVNTTWEEIHGIQDSESLRCVDAKAEERMITEIEEAKKKKETLGGVFEVVAKGVPPGLGSHIQWDQKLDGRIAQAFLSIPAVKGMSIGNAFLMAQEWGSVAHDEIYYEKGRGFYRSTNRSGGTEGGMTTGQEIRIQAAMKPLSTLMKPLQSLNVISKVAEEAVVERSDVTSVPAAGVVGEAMLALVLADALLEKFSSDSMSELSAAFDFYKKQLQDY